jgi:biopolymer transport protein ExbD
MKRLVVFMLLVIFAVAGSIPARAQKRISVEENARQSQEAQKKQQKMMKKSAKKQQKAMKKSAKAQRKAMKRAHQNSAH